MANITLALLIADVIQEKLSQRQNFKSFATKNFSQMKTKWGGCNHKDSSIRLNTDLAKKPPEYLEYVLVHEMVHLIEPTHNVRFVTLMDQHLPNWRHMRDELNRLPLRELGWV